MPKVDIESDLPKLEKRVNDLDKGVKKIAAMHKKKYAEFETVNGALWEGKDMIEDNQKKLKKEKDSKKLKKLADEIDAQETTFGKMSKKIPGLRKELGDMSTTAGNLERTLLGEKKTVAQMEKDLKRTGGDVKQLKAWSKTLKDLGDTISKASESAHFIKDTGLANTPKLK